ncbi:LVIVD repeat-containing protein [Aurantivibrio plasticivorans]
MLVRDLVVVNNYAYVHPYFQGVIIVDVSNPAIPSEVAQFDFAYTEGKAIDQNYIYHVSGQGVTVANISNPEMPLVEEEVQLPFAHDIAVTDNYLYVSQSNGKLSVLNASDLTDIEIKNQLDTPESPKDIAIQSIHLYILYENDGVVAMNIENRQTPEIVGVTPQLVGSLRHISNDSSFFYESNFGSGISLFNTLN